VSKTVKKFHLEFWVHVSGNSVRVTERNPCGCHPDDYTIYSSDKISGCWLGLRRREFLKRMSEMGFERLKP